MSKKEGRVKKQKLWFSWAQCPELLIFLKLARKTSFLPPQHSHFHFVSGQFYINCVWQRFDKKYSKALYKEKTLFILDFEEMHFLINQYILCNLKIVQRTSMFLSQDKRKKSSWILIRNLI